MKIHLLLNLWDVAKAGFRRKFVTLSVYIRKEDRPRTPGWLNQRSMGLLISGS